MTYTLSDGLRDREYNKFVANAGSISSVAVSIVSGGNFFIGSVSANVDAVYIQSGNNVHLGSAWSQVGSVLVTNVTEVGSLAVQTVDGTVITGSAVVVENFGDLGSSVVVTNDVVVNGSVVTYKDDTNYIKELRNATSISATTTDLWAAGAGSKAVATDIVASIGSPANNLTISTGGSDLYTVFLGENGGFVTNLQTPIETAVGGSFALTTTTVGSTSVTLTGYNII